MFNKINILSKHSQTDLIILLVLTLFTLTLFTGCAANYGNYRVSRNVAHMFEGLKVPNDYNYYYAGSEKDPDALMGLSRDYTLNNDLWTETKMDSKQLKKWIDEINLVGYPVSVQGYLILDPSGKTIGIYYSKYDGGPVKMGSDNQVVIFLPDTDSRRPMMLMKNDISY